jgi:translation elongation factor EF-4
MVRERVQVSNPAALPDQSVRQSIEEPFVKMEVITPSEYNGVLMDLCQSRRGTPSSHLVFYLLLVVICSENLPMLLRF